MSEAAQEPAVRNAGAVAKFCVLTVCRVDCGCWAQAGGLDITHFFTTATTWQHRQCCLPMQAALDAGATLVGKTHMDECAFSLNGENVHYGTPRNPACPDRIPGGSSSGSVVSRLAPLWHAGLPGHRPADPAGLHEGRSVRQPRVCMSTCLLWCQSWTSTRPVDGQLQRLLGNTAGCSRWGVGSLQEGSLAGRRMTLNLEPGHLAHSQGCQGGVHISRGQAARAAAGQLERQFLQAVHCRAKAALTQPGPRPQVALTGWPLHWVLSTAGVAGKQWTVPWPAN